VQRLQRYQLLVLSSESAAVRSHRLVCCGVLNVWCTGLVPSRAVPSRLLVVLAVRGEVGSVEAVL